MSKDKAHNAFFLNYYCTYKARITKQNLLTKESYNTISARLTKQYCTLITMDTKQ